MTLLNWSDISISQSVCICPSVSGLLEYPGKTKELTASCGNLIGQQNNRDSGMGIKRSGGTEVAKGKGKYLIGDLFAHSPGVKNFS